MSVSSQAWGTGPKPNLAVLLDLSKGYNRSVKCFPQGELSEHMLKKVPLLAWKWTRTFFAEAR